MVRAHESYLDSDGALKSGIGRRLQIIATILQEYVLAPQVVYDTAKLQHELVYISASGHLQPSLIRAPPKKEKGLPILSGR